MLLRPLQSTTQLGRPGQGPLQKRAKFSRAHNRQLRLVSRLCGTGKFISFFQLRSGSILDTLEQSPINPLLYSLAPPDRSRTQRGLKVEKMKGDSSIYLKFKDGHEFPENPGVTSYSLVLNQEEAKRLFAKIKWENVERFSIHTEQV